MRAVARSTTSPGQVAAISALAEQNQAELNLTADVARTELLDGRTGQIARLSEIVTGDRAVLLWYWAPN